MVSQLTTAIEDASNATLVCQIVLDSLFLDVERLDFIKIDVEGADELVCRGALETLRKHLPPVFFENNSASALRMGLKAGGTAAVLAQLGYTLYQCERERLIKVTTTTPPEGNILALHSSKAPKI
jgi:hypothetical protein